MQLYPAILTDVMNTFVSQVEAIKGMEKVPTIHVDVLDGQFADNTTLSPLDLTVLDFENLNIDFHVMTEEPMDIVFECEAVREYLPIRQIIGQVERMSNQADFLHEVKRNGWKAGLALDIFTPLEEIDSESWKEIETLLLMGIEAGQQEQMFNPTVLDKIKEARRNHPSASFKVLVDGGIKLNNVTRVLSAGADDVAVGSALWTNKAPFQVIEEFLKVAEKFEAGNR